MSRTPETRRKVPRYFAGRDYLRINWSQQGHWEVSYFCGVEGRWQYEPLKAKRIGPELEQQAREAAAKLVRLGALRWNKVSADAKAKWLELFAEAATIAKGALCSRLVKKSTSG